MTTTDQWSKTLRHAWVAAFILLETGLASPVSALETSVQVSSVQPDDELSNAFHTDRNGWIGADGAYSVRLNETTTMWTFGDTFIGKEENNKRSSDTTMINNTAAVQKLVPNSPMQFKWLKSDGKPSSLWKPKDKTEYFWPGDGIAVDGKLFVFLHKIRTDKTRPEPFQFRTVSDYIARVDNPLDEPEKWKVTYADLGNDAEEIEFGTATIRDGDYLYIYSSYGKAKSGLDAHPAVLARLSITSLKVLDTSKIEYFTKTSTWSKQANDLAILFKDGAPEMSVTKVDGVKGFVAVYMPPMTKHVSVRHAEALTGPWGAPTKVYDCPEKEDSVILYSAKAHQEFATKPNELVMTYCRNYKTFDAHFKDAGMYYPKAVRATIKTP